MFERTGNDQRLEIKQLNGSGGKSLNFTSNGIVELNRWHYIVFTVEGSAAKIYIDGKLDAQSTRNGVVGVDTQPLKISGKIHNAHDLFPGRLDEVAVYDRALSADEIEEHFRLVPEQEGPLGLLANDLDADGDKLTATLVDDVQNGALALDADGKFTYTPNAEFFGTDTFTYSVNDGTTDSNVATATITVVSVNDPPLADDDGGYELAEDGALLVDADAGVLVGDSDVESEPLTAQLFGDAQHGGVSLAPDGSFTYTPDADFFGEDSFTYVANDGENDSEPATVTITVNPIDDPTVAVDDSYTINEDVTLVATEAYAAAVVAAQPVGYWRLGETSGSTTAVDVTGNHDGVYENFAANEYEQPGTLSGDSDTSVLFDGVDNQVTVPHSEELTITGDLTVEFWMFKTAEADNYQRLVGKGADHFRTYGVWEHPGGNKRILFQQSDGRNRPVMQIVSSSGVELNQWHYIVATLQGSTAKIYIDGRLDAQGSRNGAPGIDTEPLTFGKMRGAHSFYPGRLDEVAIYDRALSAAEIEEHFRIATEQPPSVLANDVDVDGDELTATLVDDVHNGTLALNADGSFTYTPNAEFSGVDTFTYFVNDGTTESNVATATITVAPVNDPPVAVDDSYRVPTSGSLVVTAEGGMLGNDNDVENDALSAMLVAGPAHGSLQLASDGSFEYTPDATFERRDSFTYRARDGQDLSEVATVTLTLDAPIIEPGDHILRANTPGQTISILVSGEHDISGLNLFVQIGDGGPELVEFGLPAGTIGPRITAVDLKTGTIFAGVGDPQIDEPSNLPQVINATISLAGGPATVEADGTLATLTIDTTGLFGGEWDLLLSDVLPGLVGGPFETDFAGEPAIIEGGRLRIVPAEVVDRHLFYNDSVFDGRDPAAGEADDAAIAPDKTALLPGETATFANYSSFVGGITGVMLDVARLLVPEELSADDFAFRSGHSNDPAAWQPVDAPASVTVRSGAGTGGSDRVSLTWPVGTIEGTWLEVTLKSNANTGLPADDVFYFGSAVGESGNKPTDALVNATDVIAVRDNPRGPLNQATLGNRLDFNRDALVNATDLVLSRDHTTGLFSALQLITPVASAPAPGAAGAAGPQAAAAAGELPTIVVGQYTLMANMPNQRIEIFVSGGQLISGVNLVAQIGDGGPELVDSGLPAGSDGPAITSVDLKTGTIFAGLDVSQVEFPSLPQVRFSSLGIESQNTSVAADGLLVTLTIDTTGISSGSFPLLLDGVLPQLTNGPFATDFAGMMAEITSGQIIVEPASLPADLTGNGFVDFQDLTFLLANWNKFVTAAQGNLVEEDTSPVNFQDLTVLLAAWTGPGPAGAPQQRAEAGAAEASNPSEYNGADRLRATNELFGRVGRADSEHRHMARTANRRSARQESSGMNDSPLRRLQAAAVDRAIVDDAEDFAEHRRLSSVRRSHRGRP